jgi:branched-subunit amino acid transport protein AzlD
MIVVLCHQEIKVPCGQYGFNLVTKLLIAQKLIAVHQNAS